MRRHLVIFRLPIFSLLILVMSCTQPYPVSNEQPNVLFILVDDQRNDTFSFAGHSIVKTPTVDKLAAQGTVFENAFVTTSICAASRASIITGLYENSHEYTFGKDPIKEELIQSSYPYLLKQSGYKTGFVGKFGIRIENQDSMLTEMFDYYMPSPQNAPYVEKNGDGTTKHSAEIKGEQAIAFLKNQTSEKPFCLSVSFNAVHAVDGNLTPGNEGHYPYPEVVSSWYEDKEMPAPILSDPGIYENHPEFLKSSLNRERYYWRWDISEKYQTNMKAYFRMISGYDHVISKVLEALESQGLEKNTIIIFSADNGYYMGSRGFAGKWSHYEESLRIPLIIYDPRHPKPVKSLDEMALNIDIPATILNYANVPVPTHYEGRSLSRLTYENSRGNWRDSFFIEHHMDHPQIPKYVGIRDSQFVYANYYEQDPPYEYLHDLTKDPDQLTNVISNSDYKDVVTEMRSRVDQILISD